MDLDCFTISSWPCKNDGSDYHLSHALIIFDGSRFQPSLYCFTEFVDFKNSFCELNLVLVSRKRLGNVIFGTFLVRSLLERGSAAEEVRGLLCVLPSSWILRTRSVN